MTEKEWLKEKSGLGDEQLTALEAAVGAKEFTGMLKNIIAENEAAATAKTEAEKIRLDFEKRYAEEYQPQMTQLAKDNLKAQAERAAALAQLEKVREWGFLDGEAPKQEEKTERAPGSPDPNIVSRDEFGRYSASQTDAILALQDLNHEHFKLYGEPLGDTSVLRSEVNKQHQLGNKQFTLRNAWEQKYNVQSKRDEISKAARQKEIDEAISADRKARAEAAGTNPNLVSGRPSRFSTYKPQDSTQQPWQSARLPRERNSAWHQKAIQKFADTSAA